MNRLNNALAQRNAAREEALMVEARLKQLHEELEAGGGRGSQQPVGTPGAMTPGPLVAGGGAATPGHLVASSPLGSLQQEEGKPLATAGLLSLVAWRYSTRQQCRRVCG